MAPTPLLGLLLLQTVAWKELGLKLASDRKMEPAAEAFAKACAQMPQDEDACYYLARTLYTLGRYEEASEPFAKALRAAPKQMQGRVHRAMALNFTALHRADDAERHFREAVRLGSDNDPRIDYGAFLFRQGRLEEALPLLEQAVEALPGSARAHSELGRVLLHLGKREGAAARLEKAVQLDPGSSTARLLLGKTYLEMGRIEEGERQLRLGREGWKQSYDSSTVK
jgi:Tfp pilus assembly protein PilF